MGQEYGLGWSPQKFESLGFKFFELVLDYFIHSGQGLGRVHMIYMDVFGLLKAPHGQGHLGLGDSRIIGAGEGEIRFLSIPRIPLSSYPCVFISL